MDDIIIPAFEPNIYGRKVRFIMADAGWFSVELDGMVGEYELLTAMVRERQKWKTLGQRFRQQFLASESVNADSVTMDGSL